MYIGTYVSNFLCVCISEKEVSILIFTVSKHFLSGDSIEILEGCLKLHCRL